LRTTFSNWKEYLKAMVAFPLQTIYNHSFQPLWKVKKKATELPTIMESSTKKKTKTKKTQNKKQKWLWSFRKKISYDAVSVEPFK